MTIHLLGLAHTETTREFEFCAFTARTRVWASMMTQQGYDVRLYAGEHNEADVSEHIGLTTRAEQHEWFPEFDGSVPFNDFDSTSPPWRAFNARAIAAIRERIAPRDILAVTMGLTHKPVADALPELMAVEVGVGYSGVWAPYRVFESHAWRHYLAAKEMTDDVRNFDAVIPRAWEAADFPLGSGDGWYLLFMGRLTERKGPHIAALAAQRLGMKLVVAGQGSYPLAGDVEYLGVVGPAERARLMGGAVATFVPTIYLEPGGGVAIESQLCGTPVIATNYGAMTESVLDGVTGFLCATLGEFVEGARRAPELDRVAIRERALARYSTDAVGPQYARYFDRLMTLWGEGWYA